MRDSVFVDRAKLRDIGKALYTQSAARELGDPLEMLALELFAASGHDFSPLPCPAYFELDRSFVFCTALDQVNDGVLGEVWAKRLHVLIKNEDYDAAFWHPSISR